MTVDKEWLDGLLAGNLDDSTFDIPDDHADTFMQIKDDDGNVLIEWVNYYLDLCDAICITLKS